MCGISGGYNYLNKEINLKSTIAKIVKIQHNRGPDDSDIWESKNKQICFGHNRLSIIDLTKNASQPFVSSDGNLTITFNGEIYNFKEIKKELIDKKIIFKSNSDTEVIIESYKYWGLDFIKKLRGMFAFVIWDSFKKKLILARDPFGIKPLYYVNKNGFYFASQVKSLLTVESVSREHSNAGLASYYLWGNMQEQFTLYKDIKSIKMGTILILDENGNETNINYADIKSTILDAEPLNIKNYSDQKEYLSEILRETIEYHQVSDVPILLLLSAGIDSNLILAMMSEKEKKNSSALTVNFDFEGNDSEIPLAQKSAKLNNIEHFVGKINYHDSKELLNRFFKDMDLPSNDGFNNYIASHIAKENNSKIIISGVGGDEFFSGYPSFSRIPKINKALKFIPNSTILNNFFKKKIYKLFKKNKIKSKYSGIYEYGRDLSSCFLLMRSLFLPFEIEDLFSEKNLITGIEELNIIENLNKDVRDIKEDNLSIMYLETKYYLCSKLLRDADWASMSHSIELRTPFVDWFFFNKLIPLIKTNNKINKTTMLDCIKDKVPSEIYKRKKTGFRIPQKNYMKNFSHSEQFNETEKNWSTLSFKKYIKNNEKTN
jgi:asparagine synthase (glutamine-hydrolysing)